MRTSVLMALVIAASAATSQAQERRDNPQERKARQQCETSADRNDSISTYAQQAQRLPSARAGYQTARNNFVKNCLTQAGFQDAANRTR